MLTNHDLDFRHTVDNGMRVLQTLLDHGLRLPRWGSTDNTPPPNFSDLRRLEETDDEDESERADNDACDYT